MSKLQAAILFKKGLKNNCNFVQTDAASTQKELKTKLSLDSLNEVSGGRGKIKSCLMAIALLAEFSLGNVPTYRREAVAMDPNQSSSHETPKRVDDEQLPSEGRDVSSTSSEKPKTEEPSLLQVGKRGINFLSYGQIILLATDSTSCILNRKGDRKIVGVREPRTEGSKRIINIYEAKRVLYRESEIKETKDPDSGQEILELKGKPPIKVVNIATGDVISIDESGQYHLGSDRGDPITLKVYSDENYFEMKGNDRWSFEMTMGKDYISCDEKLLSIDAQKQIDSYSGRPVTQYGPGQVNVDYSTGAEVYFDQFGKDRKATYNQETGELVLENTKGIKKVIILTPPPFEQGPPIKVEVDYTDNPNSPTVKKGEGPGLFVGSGYTRTTDGKNFCISTRDKMCSVFLDDIGYSLPIEIKKAAKKSKDIINDLMKGVAASLGLKLGTEEELIDFLALLKVFYKK